MLRALGEQLLRAVLPHQLDAALGQRRQLVGGHVLDRGEDLHVRRVATSCDDALTHPLEVVADELRAQARELARHVSQTSPAWRPVTPWSRRGEKNRGGRPVGRGGEEVIFVTPPG